MLYVTVLHMYVGGYPYPALGNAEIMPFLMSHRRMERPKNCSFEL